MVSLRSFSRAVSLLRRSALMDGSLALSHSCRHRSRARVKRGCCCANSDCSSCDKNDSFQIFYYMVTETNKKHKGHCLWLKFVSLGAFCHWCLVSPIAVTLREYEKNYELSHLVLCTRKVLCGSFYEPYANFHSFIVAANCGNLFTVAIFQALDLSTLPSLTWALK